MKKIALMLALIVCFASPDAFGQKMIQSINITFITTTDDKDWNSFIRFQLQSADGSWMGTGEGTFGGRFPNGSTYSYYMGLGGNYSDWLLTNSYLYMFMAPVGNDTWNFNWILRVNFTDGTYRENIGTGGLSESTNNFRLRVF